MATKVITETLDDLDGSSPAETYIFGVGGQWYEIDLNEKNGSKLDAFLVKHMEAGRAVAPDEVPNPAKRKHRPPRTDRTMKIRTWASDNGIELSPRGRIRHEVVARYEEATGDVAA